jgi:hypothetical protein
MGYYKNEEIANQVEEPDRIPAPRPAYTHPAYRYYDSRVVQKRLEKNLRRAKREEALERFALIAAVIFIGVIAVLGWIR